MSDIDNRESNIIGNEHHNSVKTKKHKHNHNHNHKPQHKHRHKHNHTKNNGNDDRNRQQSTEHEDEEKMSELAIPTKNVGNHNPHNPKHRKHKKSKKKKRAKNKPKHQIQRNHTDSNNDTEISPQNTEKNRHNKINVDAQQNAENKNKDEIADCPTQKHKIVKQKIEFQKWSEETSDSFWNNTDDDNTKQSHRNYSGHKQHRSDDISDSDDQSTVYQKLQRIPIIGDVCIYCLAPIWNAFVSPCCNCFADCYNKAFPEEDDIIDNNSWNWDPEDIPELLIYFLLFCLFIFCLIR